MLRCVRNIYIFCFVLFVYFFLFNHARETSHHFEHRSEKRKDAKVVVRARPRRSLRVNVTVLFSLREIETFWKKQNASLRHELSTSRKNETKLKRELEKIEDRRAHERKEMKSMREALRAMREEARKHEKVTIDLEKKHEEEMRQVMEEKYRLEIGASHAFDEVLRKVKRITIVDDDSNDHL